MGAYFSTWKELWENKAGSCSKITSKGYSTDLSFAVPTSSWALTLPETCFSIPNPHLTQSSCKMKQGRGEKKKKKSWTPSQPKPECSGSTSSLHAAAGRSSAKSVWESGTQVLSTLQNSPHFNSHQCSHHTSSPEWGDHSSSSKLRHHETFKLMV